MENDRAMRAWAKDALVKKCVALIEQVSQGTNVQLMEDLQVLLVNVASDVISVREGEVRAILISDELFTEEQRGNFVKVEVGSEELLSKSASSKQHIFLIGLSTRSHVKLGIVAQALLADRTLKSYRIFWDHISENDANALALLLADNRAVGLNLYCGFLSTGLCQIVVDGMREDCILRNLNLVIDENDLPFIGEIIRKARHLRTLKLVVYMRHSEQAIRDFAAEGLAKALLGHRSLQKFQWPLLSKTAQSSCSEILRTGNGSLLDCRGYFVHVCQRNQGMLYRARQAVQTLRIVRCWNPTSIDDSNYTVFHLLPKDVVKLIVRLVWESRTEIETWGQFMLQQGKKSKRRRINEKR